MNRTAKIVLVAIAAFLIIVVLFERDKVKKFIEINKNIATALSQDPHAVYYHDDLDKEYIKKNTGTTNSIDVEELPQAFQPFKEVVHPPFRQGACQICHAPKRDKVVALVTKKIQTLCYKCHPPVKMPDVEYNCNKCHSPHQADREKLVRNKVIEEECPVGTFDTPVNVHIKRLHPIN